MGTDDRQPDLTSNPGVAGAHFSPDAADRAWREGRASGVDAAG